MRANKQENRKEEKVIYLLLTRRHVVRKIKRHGIAVVTNVTQARNQKKPQKYEE